MKKLLKEFKNFITKGNVIDLAVAVIIGGAFQKIISSVVNDIIMPLISLATGVGFADWKTILIPAQTHLDVNNEVIIDVAETAILWGSFIQKVIDFLIIAIILFAVIKVLSGINKAAVEARVKLESEIKKKLGKEGTPKEEEVVSAPAVPVAPVKSSTDVLLEEIRDLLKKEK